LRLRGCALPPNGYSSLISTTAGSRKYCRPRPCRRWIYGRHSRRAAAPARKPAPSPPLSRISCARPTSRSNHSACHGGEQGSRLPPRYRRGYRDANIQPHRRSCESQKSRSRQGSSGCPLFKPGASSGPRFRGGDEINARTVGDPLGRAARKGMRNKHPRNCHIRMLCASVKPENRVQGT
jgi:hypothetical protein